MDFDLAGARKAGAKDDEIEAFLRKKGFDTNKISVIFEKGRDQSIPAFDVPADKFDVQGALNAGATEKEIADFAVSKGWVPKAKPPVIQTISSMPEQSLWDTIVSKFYTPSVSKEKASNIVALSQATGKKPTQVLRKYDEITEQVVARTYPTPKRAAEVTMGVGAIAGMVVNPIHTITAIGAFMGLDELKNAVVSHVSGEKYEFQAGKGVSDLLKAEGFSRDAIDLLEFAGEAWGAGKVSGLTKSLANAVRGIAKPEEKIKFINEVAAETKKSKRTVEQVVKEKAPATETVEDIAPPTPSLESLEAQVKGGAIRNRDAKYAKESSINLDRLDTTEDVKAFIDGRTRQLSQEIGKKVETWDETRAKAEDLGLDWKDIIRQGKKVEDLAAQVEATRQIQMTMAQTVFDKIRNLPADRTQITPEMKMDILNDVANHGQVLVATSKMSSEIGRALNVHKKMMQSDPEFIQKVGMNKLLEKLSKDKKLEKEFDNIVEELRSVDVTDLKAVNDIVMKHHKAGIMDMIYEGWMNAILSGPKTHVVNITGSLIASAIKTGLELPVASAINILSGKRSGSLLGTATAEGFGSYNGLKDGARAFARAWKTGETEGPWTKVEVAYPKAIPSFEINIGGKMYEVGGKQIRIPTRALQAADEFFKTVFYRGSLSRQAYELAATEKLKGAKFSERVSELLTTPTKEMLERAHYDALYQTFNQPLGKFGQNVMRLRDAVPGRLGYFILPFARTITNLVKYAGERTPFNFAKIAYDYNKGKIPRAELAEELAKPIVGTTLGLTASFLVHEGYLTGGGPKDTKKRNALRSTGWQPYSLKIGDTYVSYNRYDPLGSIIGTAADLTELALDKNTDEETAKQYAGRVAFTLSRNWLSKTYLQSISGMIDALYDPVRYGENFVNSYAGSLIPSMVATVARSTDPYYRNVDTVVEAIQARLPLASEKLLPKRDLWGEPIERKGGFLLKMLSPSDISTEDPSKVDREMVRLGVSKSVPSKKIRNIELEPAEYDVYCERAGKLARRMVERFVESDIYANTRDEINKLKIENIITYARKVEGMKVWAAMERARRMKPIEKKYGLSPKKE